MSACLRVVSDVCILPVSRPEELISKHVSGAAFLVRQLANHFDRDRLQSCSCVMITLAVLTFEYSMSSMFVKFVSTSLF